MKNYLYIIFSNVNNNNTEEVEENRKNIWLAGRFALNEKEAATFIIQEARYLLKVRLNILCTIFFMKILAIEKLFYNIIKYKFGIILQEVLG